MVVAPPALCRWNCYTGAARTKVSAMHRLRRDSTDKTRKTLYSTDQRGYFWFALPHDHADIRNLSDIRSRCWDSLLQSFYKPLFY